MGAGSEGPRGWWPRWSSGSLEQGSSRRCVGGGCGGVPGVTASSWRLMAGAGHTGTGTQGGCLGFPRGSSARSVIRGGPGKSTRSRGCRCLRSGGAWRGACALGSVVTVVVPHETLPSKSCRVPVLAPLQDPCLGATLRLPHPALIVLLRPSPRDSCGRAAPLCYGPCGRDWGVPAGWLGAAGRKWAYCLLCFGQLKSGPLCRFCGTWGNEFFLLAQSPSGW